MEDLRIKPVLLLSAIVAFSACEVSAEESIVGDSVPRINVKRWVTPNPPTRANLEGRVYVIKFWATWCKPCVKSIPHMIELADKYRDRGVLFIGLSRDKSASDVKDFIRDNGINYHIGMDNGISKKFSFEGIPAAFVISHTGKVVWQGHPSNQEFKAAIAMAVKAAPQPFLAGVELGPFEELRMQLSGGRGFLRAYRRLKIETRKGSYENSKIALRIIEEVNSRINKKVEEAAAMRESNLAAAFELYRQIVKNYRGIELIEPAVAAHDELKNDQQVRKELAGARAIDKADRFLTKCRGCSSCDDFNPQCKKCAELNRTTLVRVEKILTTICKNYSETKAAKTARQRLKELNSEVLESE